MNSEQILSRYWRKHKPGGYDQRRYVKYLKTTEISVLPQNHQVDLQVWYSFSAEHYLCLIIISPKVLVYYFIFLRYFYLVNILLLALGGSLFLFDRKVLRYFRKDGHNWRKKKDGKTVKEAHERLKVRQIWAVDSFSACNYSMSLN
jgi:hypothetical protein